MTPSHYTVKGKTEFFHYKISDLRIWIKAAYEGCAGELLILRTPQFTTYRMSGTLERPRPVKRMRDVTRAHFKTLAIFGPEHTADEICNPKPVEMFKDFGIFIPGKEKGDFRFYKP